jgi:hypothetical protein
VIGRLETARAGGVLCAPHVGKAAAILIAQIMITQRSIGRR